MTILSRARSGKIGFIVVAVVCGHKPPTALGLQVVLAHQAADLLRIDDHPSMTELSANPAIAIGLKLTADRRDIGDYLSVVGLHRWCVCAF